MVLLVNMAQDRNKDSEENKHVAENYKSRAKKDKSFQTKVIIRRLPPTMTEDQFLEQVSPVPDHDYFYFVKGDLRLGQHAFSRAYFNFIHQEDVFLFKEKFDDYVFLDAKGGEYRAIVEFAPFQKIPKKRSKKRDAKCGTIESDPDYLSFLEKLKNPDDSVLPAAEVYLEEIENKEKELRANNGVPKVTTPLIEYLKQRKIEQQKIREEKREERKRKEIEKKRLREEERRRRKAEKDKSKEKLHEAESHTEKDGGGGGGDNEKSQPSDDKQPDPIVQVLKNPEREKETKEHVAPQKNRDFFVRSYRDKERQKKDWESDKRRQKDKLHSNEKVVIARDKDRSYKEKAEHKSVSSSKGLESKNTSSPVSNESKLNSPAAGEPSTTGNKNNDIDTFVSDKNLCKMKRDKSCPGILETSSNNDSHQGKSLPSKEISSASEDNCEANEGLKGNSSSSENKQPSKDPRVERRIRNKDRPSLEIYRPGMRRFNTQRSSPQKEISTSTSNSSTPSPSPTPPLNAIGTKVQLRDSDKSKVQKSVDAEMLKESQG